MLMVGHIALSMEALDHHDALEHRVRFNRFPIMGNGHWLR
jgi:hypothetical protein